MPAHMRHEPDGIFLVRISGVLKQAEFHGLQDEIAKHIDDGKKPRVLAMLENFEGWEHGADWNDLDFLMSYSNEIERIAIVGDPQWEPHALAFAGAGVRRAPVKFFSPEHLTQARRWLSE